MTRITRTIQVHNPARDAATRTHRREVAAARRAADRAQTDAAYQKALAQLVAANTKYNAALVAHPLQYVQVAA